MTTRHWRLATAAATVAAIMGIQSSWAATITSQNNIGSGATGVIGGTVQQGTTTTPFTCTYDVVSGQLSGSASCSQVVGTSGVSLTGLESQIVGARVDIASSILATAQNGLLNDLIQRRVQESFAIDAQTGSAGSTNSPSGLGSWAYAGSSFLDDDRPGLEKSGHNVSVTAGLDHAAGNLLVGGYVGYLNTDLDLKSLAGNLSANGWSLGGYMTYLFNKVFSVSASGGYSDAHNDMLRTYAGSPTTGRYDEHDWSGSVSLNAVTRPTTDLAVLFLAGMDYGSWTDNAYSDTRGIAYPEVGGDSSWGKVGTVLTLMPGQYLRPYATATYSRLMSPRSYGLGPNALNIGGGLAIGTGRLTGAFEVTTVLLQPGQSNTSISFSLHLAI